MGVYIDDANILWKGKRWCHLYADSFDELKRFGRLIGLQGSWMQHRDGIHGLPHYDVTGIKIVEAKRNGAISVTKGDGTYRHLRRLLANGEYPMEVT